MKYILTIQQTTKLKPHSGFTDAGVAALCAYRLGDKDLSLTFISSDRVAGTVLVRVDTHNTGAVDEAKLVAWHDKRIAEVGRLIDWSPVEEELEEEAVLVPVPVPVPVT